MQLDESNYVYVEKFIGRRAAMFRLCLSFFGFPKALLKLLVEEMWMMFTMLSLSVRIHTEQFRLAVKGKVLQKATLEEYRKIYSV